MFGIRAPLARLCASVPFAVLMILAVMPRAVLAQADDERLVNQSDDPILRAFSWRSVGPFGQGGRVDDLAVPP
ncbi:MAG: hypothetical protein OXH66_06110, partial [Gemmatimonadetes bacterium]|nr:hypothetical protein [Gemmatimonadota bacterium]